MATQAVNSALATLSDYSDVCFICHRGRQFTMVRCWAMLILYMQRYLIKINCLKNKPHLLFIVLRNILAIRDQMFSRPSCGFSTLTLSIFNSADQRMMPVLRKQWNNSYLKVDLKLLYQYTFLNALLRSRVVLHLRY